MIDGVKLSYMAIILENVQTILKKVFLLKKIFLYSKYAPGSASGQGILIY